MIKILKIFYPFEIANRELTRVNDNTQRAKQKTNLI